MTTRRRKRTTGAQHATEDGRMPRYFVRGSLIFVQVSPEMTIDDFAAAFREAAEAKEGSTT